MRPIIKLINHKDLQKEKREEIRKILHLDILKRGPIRDMSIELTIPPNFNEYDRK